MSDCAWDRQEAHLDEVSVVNLKSVLSGLLCEDVAEVL